MASYLLRFLAQGSFYFWTVNIALFNSSHRLRRMETQQESGDAQQLRGGWVYLQYCMLLIIYLIYLIYQKVIRLNVMCQYQWRSQPDIWSCKCKFFCVYRPYKESISKEMNNDNNDLNLHDITKLSGCLCY